MTAIPEKIGRSSCRNIANRLASSLGEVTRAAEPQHLGKARRGVAAKREQALIRAGLGHVKAQR